MTLFYPYMNITKKFPYAVMSDIFLLIPGIIMYELHAPIMIQATRQFECKTITGLELKKKLKEVIKLLTESEQILAFEPLGSPEFEMRKAAQDAIKKIGCV